MRNLWNNEILNMTIIPDTESIEYPSSNLIDPRLSRYFKTENDADQRIVFSGVDITASYIAIIAHNISSGATILLQGNNTDIWDEPDFEETLTWDSDIIIKQFTESTYNYWRLYIDDDNNDGYIRIGYIYLSTYLQMPGMEPDQQIDYDVKEGYLFRSPKINHPRVTFTQKDDINEMFAAVRVGSVDFSSTGQLYADGNVKTIVILIWANELSVEKAIYCIIEDDKLTWKKSDDRRYPYKVTIQYREVF